MEENTTAQVVNHLFERLIAINPAFRQAWPTEEEFRSTKKEWVIAFVDAGINSIEQLKKGLTKVRMNPSPFIPSPGEFISYCKIAPEDIKAPTTEKAYQEACEKSHPCYGQKNWSHPAVKHACLKTNPYFLRNQPLSKTKPAFETAYKEACNDYAEGKILNQIENKNQDTSENRVKYQEYFGEMNHMRKFSKNPGDTEILTYDEWLCSWSN